MALRLSEPLQHVLEPLFRAMPLAQAMEQLVVDPARPPHEHVGLVASLLKHEALGRRPVLAAALWLYVDELDRSHQVSQGLVSPTGSFWHAIMHRREGDFSNSKHWYRRTGKHPAMNRIQLAGGGAGAGTTVGDYEPIEFVDRVERAHKLGGDYVDLLALQRREWMALFEWCAKQ